MLKWLVGAKSGLTAFLATAGGWLRQACRLARRACDLCRRFVPKPLASWAFIAYMLVLAFYFNRGLFHLAAESYTIVAAIFVNILAARTYRYSHDYLLLFGGTSLVYAAILDAAHLLTSPTFNLFAVQDWNTPHQFWLAARYTEICSLLLLPSFVRRRFWQKLAGLACLAVTFAAILIVAPFRLMPPLYQESYQPTLFTKASAWVITLLTLISLARFWLVRTKMAREFHQLISYALSLLLAANLFFFFGGNPAAINMVAHLLRVSAYYLFYRAFVGRGLDEPYETIFAELKENAMLDPLTGICNRQGWIEYATRELAAAKSEGRSVGILLMDVDNFKQVNDLHGHQTGDEVLRRVAEILRGSIRNSDIVCRLGGDEFAVIVRAGPEGVGFVQRRIRESMEKWVANNEIAKDLGLSIGCALMGAGHTVDIDALLAAADRRMYQEKARKKPTRRSRGSGPDYQIGQ